MDREPPSFKSWLPGLQQINLLLSRKPLRDRFVETCVRPCPAYAASENVFGSNMSSTVDWRWRVVIDVTNDLKDLENVLRASWSKDTFLEEGSIEDSEHAGNEAAQACDDEAEVKKTKELGYDLITKTLKSSWWRPVLGCCALFTKWPPNVVLGV